MGRGKGKKLGGGGGREGKKEEKRKNKKEKGKKGRRKDEKGNEKKGKKKWRGEGKKRKGKGRQSKARQSKVRRKARLEAKQGKARQGKARQECQCFVSFSTSATTGQQLRTAPQHLEPLGHQLGLSEDVCACAHTHWAAARRVKGETHLWRKSRKAEEHFQPCLSLSCWAALPSSCSHTGDGVPSSLWAVPAGPSSNFPAPAALMVLSLLHCSTWQPDTGHSSGARHAPAVRFVKPPASPPAQHLPALLSGWKSHHGTSGQTRKTH